MVGNVTKADWYMPNYGDQKKEGSTSNFEILENAFIDDQSYVVYKKTRISVTYTSWQVTRARVAF
jgi:hypothetical protein